MITSPVITLPEAVKSGQESASATNQAMPNGVAVTQPALPTFPWEAGYRLVTDPVTGEQQAVPLTLFDILYPSEADIGTVFMAQGPLHDLWSRVLAVMLQAYLAAGDWLILHDVFVRWDRQASVR